MWAVCEAVTTGGLPCLFSGLSLANRKLVAKLFGFDEGISDLRNGYAHDNRLWNAHLIVMKPMAAKVASSQLWSTQDWFCSLVVFIL